MEANWSSQLLDRISVDSLLLARDVAGRKSEASADIALTV